MCEKERTDRETEPKEKDSKQNGINILIFKTPTASDLEKLIWLKAIVGFFKIQLF